MDCAFCRHEHAKTGALPGTVSASGHDHVDALLWGDRWDTGAPLTYWFSTAGDTVDAFGTEYATHAWSGAEKAAMRSALLLWTRLTPLEDPVEVTAAEDADLKWYLIGGAWFLGAHYGPNGQSTQGQGFFNKDGTGWSDLTQGGYGWITVLHELGHALGLAHPHDGGGTSTTFPGVSAWWQYGMDRQNQNTYTVMSYLDVGADYNPDEAVNYGFSATPMAFDVAAIQHVYGSRSSVKSGDTTYALPLSDAGYTAIVDTDGTDELLYTGTADATLDLRTATDRTGGHVSSAAGVWGGYTIAAGTVIERATGGSGNDVLRGNDADNVLTGGGGSNVLYGGEGQDTAMVAAGARVYKDRHMGNVHARGDGWEDVLVGIEHVYVGGAAHTLGYIGEQWSTLVAASGGNTVHLKQHGTGSGQLEVHVLARGGQRFTLQVGTGLHDTSGGGWNFALHPSTRDLVCVKMRGTSSGRLEVHELAAHTNYRTFSRQVATALDETVHARQVAGVASNGDVLVLNKDVSVVVTLTRSSAFQQATTHVTPLGPLSSHFECILAPNRDLVLLKKQDTDSNRTEVHVLAARANYRTFALQVATALEETDDSWHFSLDASRNLWSFKTTRTGSGSTEIHVLSAASQYQHFIQQTATILGEAESTRRLTS